MSRGQRRNLAKREKEESDGGKHEAVTTVQEDRDVFFDDVNDDDGDECENMDKSIYTNEEDRNDDVRVGKNMVESIKALMESNKRLKTENALLRQDLDVIRVIADPQSPDSCQEKKKKKRKRRFSRS